MDNEVNIVVIPQQIDVPELLALSGGTKNGEFLNTTREELVMSAYIADQAAHSSLSEKTQHFNKTLVRVLGARAFLHKERLWKNMEQGVECHYRVNTKTLRYWNLPTGNVVESRNVKTAPSKDQGRRMS